MQYREVFCDDEKSPAPRLTCGCRTCYRLRETNLDPRLLGLARGIGEGPSEARHMVHTCLMEYLAGRLEYASLHFKIIELLVKRQDDLWKERLAIAAHTSPFLMFKQDDRVL